MTTLTRIMEKTGTACSPRKAIVGKIVTEFMDIIVMKQMPTTGYGASKHIYDKYRIRISSGTMHSVLYSLERSKLVQGMWINGKRGSKRKLFRLTEKGIRRLEEVQFHRDLIDLTTSQIFGFIEEEPYGEVIYGRT